MPLISHILAPNPQRITIHKINKTIKQAAKKIGCRVKIIQTASEGRAVQEIQKMRKRAAGIIIFPGPWQKSGYSIQETLNIIKTPFITVEILESPKVIKGHKSIRTDNIIVSINKAIEEINKLI